MNSQPELNLGSCKKAPAVSSRDIGNLISRLRGRGWMTAGELLELEGLAKTESHMRWIRSIASASHGRILSFPGSPGYRLTSEASLEELAGVESLRHQAQEMLARYRDIQRVRHGSSFPLLDALLRPSAS